MHPVVTHKQLNVARTNQTELECQPGQQVEGLLPTGVKNDSATNLARAFNWVGCQSKFPDQM